MASSNKRIKLNDEDGRESFANKLASFEQQTNIKWPRPNLKLNYGYERLLFQQIDIDSFEEYYPQYSQYKVSTIRIYGVNDAGNSILANLHGYKPYLYSDAPNDLSKKNLDLFFEGLNNTAKTELKLNIDVIDKITIEEKRNIYGYNRNNKKPYLRIEVCIPRHIDIIRRILESGFEIPFVGIRAFETYETNIDYKIRFMADLKLVGCNWIEIPSGLYNIRENYSSKCQLEIDVFYRDIISHQPDGEFNRIAPMRILSFDIECAGRKGIFPEPEHDPIIQIANMVITNGEKEPFIRNIFTLNTCSPIVGSQVISFDNEKEMLISWAKFIRELDPDIITGYNIQNFDLSYMINRAIAIGADQFPYLGRLNNIITTEKKSTFESKQMGKRDNKIFNISGRIVFDLYILLVRDFKLRSYTLNSVSYHFLQEQKEDVHHSIIPDLQNGTDQTRRRLAVYCLKDAYLPLRILEKLMCIVNYVEMARVTGVPLGYLLTRGQQIKVISQLLRKVKELDYLIPSLEVADSGEFVGATVIEPIKGFYNIPICVDDFSSLYPSIMIAYNLCYTTLIKSTDLVNFDPTDYITTPTGNFFVKPHLRKGILPEILEDLIKTRKRTKELMKTEADPFTSKVLDGRQLALKISANSVYGFTGCHVGKLPCMEISQSVTAFGRQMIVKTKDLIEEKYSIANGFSHDSKVIYGDTDSVMINFGVDTLSEAMKLGKEAAEYVSESFIKPIKLEFEKCYYPYLLIQKKRYAGLYYTKLDTYDKMECKGIETVRRDNCTLVANLISVCLNKLLIERDPDAAVDYAKQVISDLLCNRIDISKLIITKELTKTDYVGKQAHVELANKMRKRDPGSAPKLGDRVPYVILSGLKNQKTYEKAEDPVYVMDNNLSIDTAYYLNNQISKPLIRIFEPLLAGRTESILLKGPHTLTKVSSERRYKQDSKCSNIMSNFTKIIETCLICKAVVDGTNGATCASCKEKESELYQIEISKHSYLEEKFSRLWSQCQRCQGSLHENVICTNNDCNIFYMRKKAQIDLKNHAKILERF